MSDNIYSLIYTRQVSTTVRRPVAPSSRDLAHITAEVNYAGAVETNIYIIISNGMYNIFTFGRVNAELRMPSQHIVISEV